jgi:hypothetical protein
LGNVLSGFGADEAWVLGCSLLWLLFLSVILETSKPMSNVKLTYDYTLSSIKVVSEGIARTNTKLASVLALSGVLINFGKDLPSISNVAISDNITLCFSCYFLKLLAYIFIIIAFAFGLWGLSPVSAGRIILPTQLLSEEWNSSPEEDYLTALIQEMETETLLPLSQIREQKADKLQWAVRAISASMLCLVLDEILSISLPVLTIKALS